MIRIGCTMYKVNLKMTIGSYLIEQNEAIAIHEWFRFVMNSCWYYIYRRHLVPMHLLYVLYFEGRGEQSFINAMAHWEDTIKTSIEFLNNFNRCNDGNYLPTLVDRFFIRSFFTIKSIRQKASHRFIVYHWLQP